jgi:hypothetical protein
MKPRRMKSRKIVEMSFGHYLLVVALIFLSSSFQGCRNGVSKDLSCTYRIEGDIFDLLIINKSSDPLLIYAGEERIRVRYLIERSGDIVLSGSIGGEHLGGVLKEKAWIAPLGKGRDFSYQLMYEMPQDFLEDFRDGDVLKVKVDIMVNSDQGIGEMKEIAAVKRGG